MLTSWILTALLIGADEPLAPFILETVDGGTEGLFAPDVETTTWVLFAAPGAEDDAWTAAEALATRPGLRVLALDADGAETAASAKVPHLLDARHAILRAASLTRESEAVVLNADRVIIARGDVGSVAAWLDAGDATAPLTAADGTALPAPPDAQSITFAEHVAPILHAQCLDCHREGQVGPMSLLEFEEARGWAPMIAEVVGEQRMPPWDASPKHGRFDNARLLTATERQTLIDWAEAGAPSGDLSQTPTAPTYDDTGWKIGTPDHIIQLPEAQEIPATGFLPYRHITVETNLEEDRWVQAVEVRPTDASVVHHILAILIPPVRHLKLIGGTQGRGNFIERGYFAVNVPGDRPNIYPEGMGKFLPKGSRFMLQIHYTPNGVPTTDQTQVGFVWADEPPEHQLITRGITNVRLRIPPHDPAATFEASYRFRQPARLTSFFPHMHTRGKAFTYELVTEAGERRVLLDVPEYDFNWQAFYALETPVDVQAGDKILCTAVYDNSEGNPFNPDPSRWVPWGDQTVDEMLIGYLDFYELETDAK